MKLLDLWDDLSVPEDLVYFTNDGDRLVTNPETAAWCVLTEQENRLLQSPARRGPRPGPGAEESAAAERTLGRLVLNWLVYLPGRRPAIREPNPQLTTVYYAITDGCNLRCPYCYASSEKALPGELTTAESLDLVDQIADMGVQQLIFTGGEPMLRKDLFHIVRHARERGLAVNMITNGTVIRRPETAREIAELFNLVTVSVDGGTAEMHERTRARARSPAPPRDSSC